MKRQFTRNPLRWFLLLWVGLVATGSLIGSHNLVAPASGEAATNSGSFYVLYTAEIEGSPGMATDISGTTHPLGTLLQGGVMVKPALPLSSILFSLLLVVLTCFLLWCGLSGDIAPRYYWLYFLFLGVLVLLIHLVVLQTNLTLNLCLALTLCALAMLKRVAPVLLTGTGYLLLFLFSIIITLPMAATGNQWVVFWLNIWSFSDSATMVLFVVGYLILYIQQTRSQTQLEQAHGELQTTHVRLTTYSEQIEALTLLTERQRMARELHDTLAQGLAGMIIQLEVTSTHLVRQNYQQAQQILQQMLGSARETLANARHAITDLRSRTSHTDQLLEEIREELAHFRLLTGIQCDTYLDGLTHVPPQFCETILRFASEGLSNIARHADAHEVSIEARVQKNWLEITIKDDGRGFDPRHPKAGHYGLLGLRERAHLVHGMLSIQSAISQGTRLGLRVPIPNSSELFQASLSTFNTWEVKHA
jgi:NarL family two-component system sensor histidine kinase YdfH